MNRRIRQQRLDNGAQAAQAAPVAQAGNEEEEVADDNEQAQAAIPENNFIFSRYIQEQNEPRYGQYQRNANRYPNADDIRNQPVDAQTQYKTTWLFGMQNKHIDEQKLVNIKKTLEVNIQLSDLVSTNVNVLDFDQKTSSIIYIKNTMNDPIQRRQYIDDNDYKEIVARYKSDIATAERIIRQGYNNDNNNNNARGDDRKNDDGDDDDDDDDDVEDGEDDVNEADIQRRIDEYILNNNASIPERIYSNDESRFKVEQIINNEVNFFKSTFEFIKNEPTLNPVYLMDFVFLYEDILLKESTKKKKIDKKNELTIYYFADIKSVFEQSRSLDEIEEKVINRFVQGSFYIRRILSLVNRNYLPPDKPPLTLFSVLKDLELRNLFLDTARLMHLDNLRKLRSAHKSLVDLKSSMHRLHENFVQLASKEPSIHAPQIKPQLNLITPINFARIPDFGTEQFESLNVKTTLMLIESTAMVNVINENVEEDTEEDSVNDRLADGLDARRSRKRKSNANDDEFKQHAEYNPLEKAVYVMTRAEVVGIIRSEVLGKEYKPLLTLLVRANQKLYSIVSRVISRVTSRVRQHRQVRVEVDLHDAIYLIIEDDYARGVFCEACGCDRFETLGQSYQKRTKFQLHMAVKLSEQHEEYLVAFLVNKYQRL